MQLLQVFENIDEAERSASLIVGEKKLASERDGTETIYNLFGVASWEIFISLVCLTWLNCNILLN